MNVFVGGAGNGFVGVSEVFIILFVTFGPINFINRFNGMTTGLDRRKIAGLAARNSLLATVAIVLSGIVGSFMLNKWRISIPALAITAAIVLFAAAMRSIVALYRSPELGEAGAVPAASQFAFPYLATPYGIAATLVLLALAPESAMNIYGCVLAIMIVDLLLMVFVKPVMRVLSGLLGILATLFSVLQLALSIQFALFAVRTMLANGF
jgi:small neutral amino acid transporter SnatA (MarC family)